MDVGFISNNLLGPSFSLLLWSERMKHSRLSFRSGFRLSVENARSQGAVTVLAVGGKEGGPNNFHRGADQWLIA